MAEHYTNFCARAGGSNLNAGTLTGDTTEPGTAPSFAYNGTFAANTFTVTSGAQGGSTTNPQADGVTAGMFVHVSNGAVARIARIASVTTSTIVLDGTATVGSGVGATLANVGGAWAGPAAGVGFPVGTMTNAVTNSTGNDVRLNLKNDQTYSISTGLTQNQGGITIEGYTTAYGDQGMFTLDGGTNAIVLLTVSAGTDLRNAKIQNNGTTGTNAGISHTGGFLRCFRVVVNTVRGAGISLSSLSYAFLDECELYGCNGANTASSGAILLTGTGLVARNCIIHDNVGANNNGLAITGTVLATVMDTVFDTNANDGILLTAAAVLNLTNVDFYNNGRDGLESTSVTAIVTAKNCNQVKNGRYGFEQPAGATRNWYLRNCGYGAGTQANVSGATSGVNIQEYGAITYAADVTPWVDPANGDFRINLAAAKGTGRGNFTQTAASYAGTVGYPDVGAAQHLEPASLLLAGGMTGGMQRE